MNISKTAQSGMGILSPTKADQGVSRTESNRDRAFYQDIKRAVEKSERQQAAGADKAQSPQRNALKDAVKEASREASRDAAAAQETDPNVNEQDVSIDNEGEAQDVPEEMAADPAAMAALAAMQLMQAAMQQDASVQDVHTDAAQQAVAVLPGLEQDVEQDVMPDMAAPTDGEEPAVAPKTAATQDAKFVEQVFDEIRQAVVSNEAERTVSAGTQGSVAQEAPETMRQGEYDYLHTENTHTGDTLKQADVSTAHAAPMQENAGAPIEVALDKGDIAPRAAQNTFFEGVLDQVRTAVNEQQSEIYVRLKPDVLGGLAIHLVMTEEGLSAQVKTSNQHLQAMISAEVSQLEAALRDRGVNVVEMNVIYEQSAGNQYLDQHQHRQGQGDSRQGGTRQVLRVADDGMPYDKLYESMVPTQMGEQEGVEYTA